MADYPNVPIDNATTLQENSSDQTSHLDVSDSGKIRGRVGFSNPVYRLSLVHSMISAADATALREFYRDNKRYAFTFAYDGAIYTMRFQAEPIFKKQDGTLWDVRVTAVGNKN